ncbi:chorismate mutase [Curvivirga sp.]|uniref:chorismate mutase n=1 Tax=Curvivirga sp. TaxID=2856848 RepID=UPI003B59CE50
MREIEYCETMTDVRRNIDRLDEEIITLLKERAGYVAQAGRIKQDANIVRIPERIEQVIDNVKRFARNVGLDEAIAEAAYRPMVDAYIDFEMREFKKLEAEGKK